MKKPTYNQRKRIEKELKLDASEYFVKMWHEHKGGIDVCLVNRESGEILCVTLN